MVCAGVVIGCAVGDVCWCGDGVCGCCTQASAKVDSARTLADQRELEEIEEALLAVRLAGGGQ